MRYWKLLGGYNAESTTYSELAMTGLTSPYTPTEDARLKGLRVISSADAATTLQEHIQFKLTCQTFKPNSIECGGQGSGLVTVPIGRGGIMAQNDWDCDQEVKAGVPITIEARNQTADTPVGVSAFLWGLLEN